MQENTESTRPGLPTRRRPALLAAECFVSVIGDRVVAAPMPHAGIGHAGTSATSVPVAVLARGSMRSQHRRHCMPTGVCVLKSNKGAGPGLETRKALHPPERQRIDAVSKPECNPAGYKPWVSVRRFFAN